MVLPEVAAHIIPAPLFCAAAVWVCEDPSVVLSLMRSCILLAWQQHVLHARTVFGLSHSWLHCPAPAAAAAADMKKPADIWWLGKACKNGHGCKTTLVSWGATSAVNCALLALVKTGPAFAGTEAVLLGMQAWLLLQQNCHQRVHYCSAKPSCRRSEAVHACTGTPALDAYCLSSTLIANYQPTLRCLPTPCLQDLRAVCEKVPLSQHMLYFSSA